MATTALGHAARLRAKLSLVVPMMVAAGDRLLHHPRVAELYPEYLVASHWVIRASVPLMETARERARAAADDDAGAAASRLASYLDAHVGEERGHDDWLLDDLAVLGVDRADVLARTPSPTVAELVGAQYYWTLHHDPVAVLGYVAVLEGYPPSRELAEELIARTGHPRKAFRTLLAHAALDPGHRDDLDAVLDELPLTGEQQALIGLSALTTARLLTAMLDDVVG